MYKPKSSKTKSRDRWGDWSDWVWSDEQQRYYKWRQSQDGAYDYEWAPQDERTPRRDDLDDVTKGVEKLTTSGSAYQENSQVEDPVTYGSSPEEYAYSAGPKTTKPPKTTTSSSRKGKSRAYNDEREEEEDAEDPSDYQTQETRERERYRRQAGSSQPHQSYDAPSYQPTSQSHGAYQTYAGSYGHQPYQPPESEVSSTYPSTTRYPTSSAETDPSVTASSRVPTTNESEYGPGAYGSGYGPSANSKVRFASQPDEEAEEEDHVDNENYQRALNESRQAAYGQQPSYDPGESSSTAASGYGTATSGYGAAASGYGTAPSTYGATAPAYAPRTYDPEQERQSTPTPGVSVDIRGTGGDTEILDPRYKVETSSAFAPGEVFKVLWSEPSGNVGGTPTISDRKEIRNQFGSFYVGFRRFVVIANDEGHCTCVPILTYGGKGCNKKGVKPQKHGIVHEKGHKARSLPGEPKLGFPPVRMTIEAEGEKLAKESRANYSKLVTVEHNVKVFFIGHVVPEDWELVRDAVNKCWEDKIHHKRKIHNKYPRG